MNPFMILGPLIEIGREWLSHRSKLKEVKRQSEIRIAEKKTEATIKRIENGDTHAATMDQLSVGERGWKDDYLLIIATIPLLMAFSPALLPLAIAGFAALDELPEWYMWVVLGLFIDTFGFRRMIRVALEGWLSRKFK